MTNYVVKLVDENEQYILGSRTLCPSLQEAYEMAEWCWTKNLGYREDEYRRWTITKDGETIADYDFA